jgi:antirestriction protein
MEEPIRVYVVCLASYNNGNTYGKWLDVNDDLSDSIQELLFESPIENAEDWAIHGYEGFYNLRLDESMDIDELIELGRLINEYGESYTNYVNWTGGLKWADESNYLDSHQGLAESKEEFIQEQWEETGTIDKMKEIGIEFNYIDWNYLVHEWFDVGDYSAIPREDNFYDIFVSQ